MQMIQKKSGFFVFLPVLCVSLVILGTFFLLFAVFVRRHDISAADQNVTVTEYRPGSNENLSGVFFLYGETEDKPRLILPFSYDAPKGNFHMALLSSKFTDLFSKAEKEGPAVGMNALHTSLSLPIDRYFVLRPNGLTSLVNFFGGVDGEIPSDVTLSGDTFLGGRQLLDGRRISALLLSETQEGYPNSSQKAELCQKLLVHIFSPELSVRTADFENCLFQNSETSLTRYDCLLREHGFQTWLNKNALQVECRAFNPLPADEKKLKKFLSAEKP